MELDPYILHAIWKTSNLLVMDINMAIIVIPMAMAFPFYSDTNDN
jgi:hypothetical protein